MHHFDQLSQRWAPAAAILGGLTWIVYTLAALLQPWGPYMSYTISQGVAAVSNRPAFLLVTLSGGLALLLLGWALTGAARSLGTLRRLPGQIGVALGVGAGVAGLVVWGGALLVQPALATSAMNAGALLLAGGVLLVASASAGHPLALPFFIVGVLGLAAILALALVSLVSWMLPVYAALVLAVYGFAWVRLGSLLAKG